MDVDRADIGQAIFGQFDGKRLGYSDRGQFDGIDQDHHIIRRRQRNDHVTHLDTHCALPRGFFLTIFVTFCIRFAYIVRIGPVDYTAMHVFILHPERLVNEAHRGHPDGARALA